VCVRVRVCACNYNIEGHNTPPPPKGGGKKGGGGGGGGGGGSVHAATHSAHL